MNRNYRARWYLLLSVGANCPIGALHAIDSPRVHPSCVSLRRLRLCVCSERGAFESDGSAGGGEGAERSW